MPATDTFHLIEIPTGYTTLTFDKYQLTVHHDTRTGADPDIIFEFGTMAGAVFTPIA